MYARNKESEKAVWKKHVRTIFRKKIQEILESRFQFYALAPKPATFAKGYMDKNLKKLIGKVFSPFTNEEVFVLALENTEDEKERKENNALLTELTEHFFVTKPGDFALGQDPMDCLRSMGYTQGADSTVDTEELMLVSSIDRIVNPNVNELINGTAAEFVSGHKPNKSLNLKHIKYFAPVSNHNITGAYEVVSIGVTYIDEADQPVRLLFKLGAYHKFKQTIRYGINQLAAMGTTLTPQQLANSIKDNTPYQGFSFIFDKSDI